MKLSIIGAAGYVGSSAAFRIATQGLVDEMVLIDRDENMLAIHALDLLDVIVACNQDIQLVAGNFEDLADSDVVIIAANAPFRTFHSRQELVSENLPIILDISKKIEQFSPNAIVITVTNPVETFSYALYLLNPTRDRRRFIGYSYNDTIRFRRWVAETLGIKPSKVKAVTMGEHGDSQVPIFSSVRVDNQTILLDESTKQDIRNKAAEYIHKWQSFGTSRSSAWMSGLGLAAMVQAIRNDTRELFVCCAVLAGEYGYEGISMSVPVILGRQGIQQILEWELLPDEQEDIKKTTSILIRAAHSIEQALDLK